MSEHAMNAGQPGGEPVVLAVDDLHVRFRARRGEVHAVRGVSLTLHRGEVLGIVGESGCGKSTTALSLPHLLPASATVTARAMTVDGVDLTGSHDAYLRIRGTKLGMVFQDPSSSLNPTMTIGRQIAEPLTLHQGLSQREAMGRACELLARVGIRDHERRVGEYPHRLSGGERQRVMIAIAIACSPPVVIADEATTALDVTVQAEILDLLRSLRAAAGTAVVFVSHDLGVVGDFADRVAVMYAGRVVETGTVREVLRRPRHPYTVGLLGCAPRLGSSARDLKPIEGMPPDLTSPVVGCAFRDRCSRAVERCAVDDPVLAGPQSHALACWNPHPLPPAADTGGAPAAEEVAS